MYQVYSGPMYHVDFNTLEEAKHYMELVVADNPDLNATLIQASDFKCLYYYNCVSGEIKEGSPW